MKEAWVKKLGQKLQHLIGERELSVKQLSEISGIHYTTLNPIVNGTQECGFTKLIQLAEALNIEVDELLEGFYTLDLKKNQPMEAARYYAVFITAAKVNYSVLFDKESREESALILQFSLRCGESPAVFIEQIESAIEKLATQLNKKINLKEVAVFLSVLQYGREQNRRKIEMLGNRIFHTLIMESDALTNYRAFVGNKNGICISINDGDAINFSTTGGKEIQTLHGYGFPISDVAGNFWLGCEAIKHTIRVKEGLEDSSPLSDRLLALYNNDAYFLSASTMEDPSTHYLQASALIKELFYEQKKSYALVEESAKLLMENIKILDKQIGRALPICLSGELSFLYEPFFPVKRLIKNLDKQSDVLLQYGLSVLNQHESQSNQT